MIRHVPMNWRPTSKEEGSKDEGMPGEEVNGVATIIEAVTDLIEEEAPAPTETAHEK